MKDQKKKTIKKGNKVVIHGVVVEMDAKSVTVEITDAKDRGHRITLNTEEASNSVAISK
jgi:hypothetical protein